MNQGTETISMDSNEIWSSTFLISLYGFSIKKIICWMLWNYLTSGWDYFSKYFQEFGIPFQRSGQPSRFQVLGEVIGSWNGWVEVGFAGFFHWCIGNYEASDVDSCRSICLCFILEQGSSSKTAWNVTWQRACIRRLPNTFIPNLYCWLWSWKKK